MKSFYKISLILLYLFIGGKSLIALPLSDSVVVAKDGSGDFTTVGAAFNSIPNNNTTWKTIYIKKGTYYEKDTLASTKNYVRIVGENRDSSIITYDDYSGKWIYPTPIDSYQLGTSTCQSLLVLSSNVQFQNLTIQNTLKYIPGSPVTVQAVAVNIKGDKIQFVDCNLFGYQDTYYTNGVGRSYHRNCHIEGTTDFIFGNGIAVFDSCDILIKKNSTYTAAETDTLYKFGYVFLNCQMIDSSCTSTLFGRPWHNSPRVVLLQCYESAAVAPIGWEAWTAIPALYAEYNCSGPGYNPAGRDTSLSRQLTSTEAVAYTLQNIFAATSAYPNYSSDWMPWYITSVTDKNVNEIPGSFSLNQNYPNPFNPSTAISYRLSAVSQTTLKVYDILGREVATLVNEVQQAGNYKINFNAGNLPSGVYFYKLQAGNFNETKKMLLIK
jgi:pectinesterase